MVSKIRKAHIRPGYAIYNVYLYMQLPTATFRMLRPNICLRASRVDCAMCVHLLERMIVFDKEPR